LNEYVRLSFDFSDWAFFKVAILVPLTVLYALPQIKLLKKYKPAEAAPAPKYNTRPASSTAKSDVRMDSDALREPVS
jgi:hypothetical protein